METYTTEEYQYVFDDIEFEQYIQSHDTTQPIIIGDIIVNEGTEKQQNSGTIKSNQTPEKSKNEQNTNIETSHQLGFHSVLDCLHDQVCTALRDDVSDNSCGLRIRHQMPRKNIRMGSESTFFENSEVAHRSENNIQCTAVKMGKSPILFDKLDYPPYLVTNVADNQNGEFRKATSAYGNESRDSNMDNRTLISQVQANERLYQGGDNTVKRNESTANTVIMVGGNESRVSNTVNRTPISQAQTNEMLYQGGNNSVKRKESITNTGTVIMVDDNGSRVSNTVNRTPISQAQTNERLYQGGNNSVKRKESITNTGTVIMVDGNESRVSNTDNRTPISQAKTNERLYQGGSNSVKRKESITNTGTVIMVDGNESRVSNTVNRTPISQAKTNERLYQGGNNSVKRKESITNTGAVIMVDDNGSRVSNTDNRTPISQAKTNEILFQGGNNSVKRKESITNTVINNLFNCGDAHDINTTGKQSTGSVITEVSGYNPHTLFKNNESPVMKRPYHDTGDTRNSSKEKIQCIKRPKINTRIDHKKYFEKNSKN